MYSTFFLSSSESLGFSEKVPLRDDLYSVSEMILRLIRGEIAGFMFPGGNTADLGACAWIAQQWGADVEYASGEKFVHVPFGDRKTCEQKRNFPRDEKGLLIIGDKADKYFEGYRRLYGKRSLL